jgi:hypothetical protein
MLRDLGHIEASEIEATEDRPATEVYEQPSNRAGFISPLRFRADYDDAHRKVIPLSSLPGQVVEEVYFTVAPVSG